MRNLTGNWYLKKKMFGYIIMVEHEICNGCPFDFGFVKVYSRAKPEDVVKLEIKTI